LKIVGVGIGEEVTVGVTEGVPDLVEVVVLVSVEDGVTVGVCDSVPVPEGDGVWDSPKRMVSAQKRKRRTLFMVYLEKNYAPHTSRCRNSSVYPAARSPRAGPPALK